MPTSSPSGPSQWKMMFIWLAIEAQGVVHAEKAFVVKCMATINFDQGHFNGPLRQRLTATGGIHGPHGADLTVFTSEGWA